MNKKRQKTKSPFNNSINNSINNSNNNSNNNDILVNTVTTKTKTKNNDDKNTFMNSKQTPDDGPAITAKELKELRRVFDELCFFADKHPKKERLKEIQSQLNQMRRPGNGYSNTTDFMTDSGTGTDTSIGIGIGADNDTTTGNSTTTSNCTHQQKSQDISILIEKLQKEQRVLEDEIKNIASKPDQHIRSQDTGIAMKCLGKRVSKREIQEFMWEVDEKIDGFVDWEEFSLMFERNVRDMSGLEPANFYHMVQFMIYDRDGNGKVSIDETMNMLYARLGRAKMETTISKLFGGEDGAPIVEVGEQGGEIDFEHYWSVSENEQMKMFESSELGRNLAEKRKAKR